MPKKYKRVPTELGERPVGRLLWQYALPAIIAMTATSLYNIVDRAFIGHCVGKQALAGLAATFPFMNLGAAFGAMVGGRSSCCSTSWATATWASTTSCAPPATRARRCSAR